MDNQQTPAIPPQSDMVNYLLETLKNQGLSFVLLGVAVWYLQGNNDRLANEIRACQQEKYDAMIQVIESNTHALNALTYGKEEEKTARITPARKKQ